MADVKYNKYKMEMFKGSIDLENDTLKAMLVTSSYTPDQDADIFIDDVTNEISGTGYTAGGKALTSKAATQDDTDNEGVFDADDVEWATSTITARGCVLYKDTGTPSTSPLICYFDFGVDKSTSATTFIVQFGSEGVLNVGD